MLTVVVAALGYFVDIFDLLLFGIVRVNSLKDLGIREEQIMSVGVRLINLQMSGMLCGGLIWGVLGDKRGRVSVLFGSILLYSVANILNAYVSLFGSWAVFAYGVLRFIAGIGLAGELGAGITLVSETLSRENRGYGTTVVATLGVFGGVFAGYIAERYPWQQAYLLGGIMGLALLALRIATMESHLYHRIDKDVIKGNLRFFLKPAQAMKYVRCVLIGLPIWFVIGILITFSPELARAMGVQDDVLAGKAIIYCYLGLGVGDFAAGLLSQWFRTRKKIVSAFLVTTLFTIAVYLTKGGACSPEGFYFLCCLLGIGTGYWAIFVTAASEQFGTNLRATVTTTVPNFVRGSVVLLTLSFEFLSRTFGLVTAAGILAVLTVAIAAWALSGLDETFGKDLDYQES